jgi:4a-hydroxytetrahydrobiopterin dehydratase
MNSFTVLTPEEITTRLAAHPEWSIQEQRLVAIFTFKDFKQAFAFISMVALYAEQHDHHPEWSNTYNKVSFQLSTHDAGNKITTLDTDAALYISQAAARLKRQ